MICDNLKISKDGHLLFAGQDTVELAKKYGTPVYQYIRSCKMKAAAEMLISDRRMNVADIAQRLGYDNASKFSAAFRDVMGVSPQNHRRDTNGKG